MGAGFLLLFLFHQPISGQFGRFRRPSSPGRLAGGDYVVRLVRAGNDYQDQAFGNLGNLINSGSIGSIGNGGQIGISAGRGHTYNRRGGSDYEDGIYIGNTGNQGNWGNNGNIGNNANEGISLGRGTNSARAGTDYQGLGKGREAIDKGLAILDKTPVKDVNHGLDIMDSVKGSAGTDYQFGRFRRPSSPGRLADYADGIYIGNANNQGNWGNNGNIGNNANDGISLGRGTNSARTGTDYQGNVGDIVNAGGSIGSIGNAGRIDTAIGSVHTYNSGESRPRSRPRPGSTQMLVANNDYADEGIYIGNTGNIGNWGNNDNIGNNANDGISFGRGTRSRRAGVDYGDEHIFINSGSNLFNDQGSVGSAWNQGSMGSATGSAFNRAGIDYQGTVIGNQGDIANFGSIGSIGNGGNIGISAGRGHTYNRQFGRFRRPSSPGRLAGGDYEDGIYIGNSNNVGHWGNNGNVGNNANDGISLGRGTRSRRAGIDYADEGIYIGNTDNVGNWGNNANTGNNANEGISLGRGDKSVSPSTSVSTSVSGGGGGSDYLSLDSAKIIAEKKGNGKAAMSIDNAKALGFDKDCFPYCAFPVRK